MLSALVPDPSWLNPGDTAWQLTSATLVGIMSIPGLAILYAGLMKRKWAVNSALMVVYAFAMTLVVWMFFAYDMSFGHPAFSGAPGALSSMVGLPHSVAGATDLTQQASIPLLSGLIPDLRFPMSSLVYFQFVFAAITVIILGGALLGRISFRAWALFVPLWITLVYSVGAFSLWGGGWLSAMGAVDYSGGYVIHVAAAASAFVAAAMVGPRLLKDRGGKPSNLMLAVAGGGLLWLGWSGFNGGDPYFANADASAAVLNTHLCTATALLVWLLMDVFFIKRANVTGMLNGMIAGLVAITPAAGYVNGYAALIIGVVAGVLPWLSMNKLGKTRLFTRVDDTLGVFHTHGVAGASGGLLTGLLASPNMIVYIGTGTTASVSVTGLVYGNPHQLAVQALALAFIIGYDVVATFIVIKLVSFVVPLRMTDAELETGDEHLHGEVAIDLQPHEPLPIDGHGSARPLIPAGAGEVI
jgi:ammonium transporter, Amt family